MWLSLRLPPRCIKVVSSRVASCLGGFLRFFRRARELDPRYDAASGRYSSDSSSGSFGFAVHFAWSIAADPISDAAGPRGDLGRVRVSFGPCPALLAISRVLRLGVLCPPPSIDPFSNWWPWLGSSSR